MIIADLSQAGFESCFIGSGIGRLDLQRLKAILGDVEIEVDVDRAVG
jgi:hypothetical protein